MFFTIPLSESARASGPFLYASRSVLRGSSPPRLGSRARLGGAALRVSVNVERQKVSTKIPAPGAGNTKHIGMQPRIIFNWLTRIDFVQTAER